MSENKMPAKVWLDGTHAFISDLRLEGDVAYVRADIAEQMAEALADLIGHAKWVAAEFDIHYAHLSETEAVLSLYRKETA